jgi:prepilin-type N-terminal cleavage/methylation domain-containing protein
MAGHGKKARFFGDCGFTLTELIVTIGIGALLMGIAIPSFLSWLPTLRLSDGARQVAIELQEARMKAISQSTRFRLNFTTTTSYLVERFNTGTNAFETESGAFNLPQGITATAGATSEFQPRGTANITVGNATITFTNVNGDTSQVQINAVGRVKMS